MLGRQKAQGGWDAEGKPQGERRADKDRAAERRGGRRRARLEVETGQQGGGRAEERGHGVMGET